MHVSESESRFASEWTEVMYKKFHRQHATCVLVFTGNRLRKSLEHDSRLGEQIVKFQIA